MIGNPLQALRQVQRHLSALTEELRQLVSKRRGESDEELQLYHGPRHDQGADCGMAVRQLTRRGGAPC